MQSVPQTKCTDTDWFRVELEMKAMRRFVKISQSGRRPLLGPSSG